jgi:mono/diheme cytochrome c family protein
VPIARRTGAEPAAPRWRHACNRCEAMTPTSLLRSLPLSLPFAPASLLRSLPLVALLAACGTDTASDPDPDPAGDAPTYWQDVEPIFATNCAGCHTAGEIGPFAIDDPSTAASLAPQIAAESAARRMPPWPPGGDTPPLRHVRSLTQEQIDKIAAWAAAGAPLGDPARPQPHDPPEVIDIGATELGFDLGVDYVPDGELTDDYRCFLVDLRATSARVATGFKITPGNRATVHHVIVNMVSGADRATLEALDAQTPDRAGWPCVGGAIPQDTQVTQVGSLGSWVPGVSAVAYPAGTGQLVPAGALAVMQMHYNLLGGMAPDRTRVDVALAPPEANATLIRLGGISLLKRNLQIAADDGASVHTQSATLAQWRALRGQQPYPSGYGYVLGAGGHMHLIGRHLTITRTNAAGSNVILDIPAWSFHWQGQYELATPIQVANTDTLTIRCEYDNSNEHRLALGLTANMPVTWGEGTQDEMCLAGLQMVDRLP